MKNQFNNTYRQLISEHDDDDMDFGHDGHSGSGHHTFDFMDDNIDGEDIIFGVDGRYYVVEICISTHHKGRGEDISLEDVDSFSIVETDSDGNEIRTTDQIKRESPELFRELYQYALQGAMDKAEAY